MSDSSAPNAARQSPPPESQSGDQGKATLGSGNISDDKGEKGGSTSTAEQESSEETKLSGLDSNPAGPMDGPAQEKVSKEH